jgi:hypothetical protein
MGTPGVKQQGLRMGGDILPLPQCVFVAWYLVKHKDKFRFLNTMAGTTSPLRAHFMHSVQGMVKKRWQLPLRCALAGGKVYWSVIVVLQPILFQVRVLIPRHSNAGIYTETSL